MLREDKLKIVSLVQKGYSRPAIAETLGCSLSDIGNIMYVYNNFGEDAVQDTKKRGGSRPGAGRKRGFSGEYAYVDNKVSPEYAANLRKNEETPIN